MEIFGQDRVSFLYYPGQRYKQAKPFAAHRIDWRCIVLTTTCSQKSKKRRKQVPGPCQVYFRRSKETSASYTAVAGQRCSHSPIIIPYHVKCCWISSIPSSRKWHDWPILRKRGLPFLHSSAIISEEQPALQRRIHGRTGTVSLQGERSQRNE